MSFSLRRFNQLALGPEPTNDYTETLIDFYNIYNALYASQNKIQNLICASYAFSESRLAFPILVTRPTPASIVESLHTLYWTPSDDTHHLTTVNREGSILWIILTEGKSYDDVIQEAT